MRGTTVSKPTKGARGVALKIGDKIEAKRILSESGRRVTVGAKGVVAEIRPLTTIQSKTYHGRQKAILKVRWAKGGTWYNVYPKDIKRR